MHKWLEDVFDTLIYICAMIGLLGFFMYYFTQEYQLKYAEVIIQEFLDKTAISGRVTETDYVSTGTRLYNMNSSMSLELFCNRYKEIETEEKISKEQWRLYFQSRNVRKDIEIIEYVEQPEINAEEMKLQSETNASILAAETEYLPLREENDTFVIQAMRPRQEVYEGEELITLCRVDRGKEIFFVEAEPLYANETGSVNLSLYFEDILYEIPIEIICHLRTRACDNGHTFANTKEVMEEEKENGVVICPFCNRIPEKMLPSSSVIRIMAGEELSSEIINVMVQYKDGTVEYITPESKDWQDDYDREYCGRQTVCLQYRGSKLTFEVLTENTPCSICKNPCNERCYRDNLEYPYCLDCLSALPMVTGKQLVEELVSLTEFDREYLLKRGDFITAVLSLNGQRIMIQRKIRTDGTSEGKH